MAAAGKAKEADAARCRRHPSHRHAAGVCPFCLSDRLSRLSAAAGAADAASEPSSASSSGAASVASAQTAPPCREARRARLGMLMRQEEPEATGHHGKQEAAAAEEGEKKKPAKRGNFWTRLQQASWYRRDGCSVASVKKGAAAPPHKRAASLF
ncbi:uncharacterized protein [Aegilops tauschii subsp. strangulata]|nr:uncharacterized protein LOC109733029 [Aegilops tauschii subsp. strangulata]XP_040253787.1 uncharacterized protein LOC120961796 [Aegilops tauschii subsp. strangulata]XP_044442635.1 uncharacterized protein LOC123168837 [Triticum aestivum]